MGNVYLLTGGNIGDRSGALLKAMHLSGQHFGTFVQSSSVYETAPWGKEDQANFYNQVLQLQTTLSPKVLLQQILEVEQEMGRLRFEKNGPRVIDIDILFYDDLIINEPGLEIPHPRIQYRRFVLTPLAEIAGSYRHPVLHKTMDELLAMCKDPLAVTKVYTPGSTQTNQ